MSLSFMARTRFQSVLEALEENRFFRMSSSFFRSASANTQVPGDVRDGDDEDVSTCDGVDDSVRESIRWAAADRIGQCMPALRQFLDAPKRCPHFVPKLIS